MTIKTVDKQGRLVLGRQFANQTVLVEESESRIVIVPAKVMPAHEVWLYQNEEALRSVLTGIEQARNHQFASNPPDIDADLRELGD